MISLFHLGQRKYLICAVLVVFLMTTVAAFLHAPHINGDCALCLWATTVSLVIPLLYYSWKMDLKKGSENPLLIFYKGEKNWRNPPCRAPPFALLRQSFDIYFS